MTLADWRDSQMASGLIAPDAALDICMRIAELLDSQKFGGAAWPSLCPECVEVEVDGSSSVVKVVAIAEADNDAACPYRAPEIADGGSETAASCQFSLACILYELLVGRVPDAMSALAPGVLRPAQGRALLRALSVKPARRFRSCSEMVGAVSNGRDGRGWIPFAVVLLVVAVVGACWLAWDYVRGQMQKDRETVRAGDVLVPGAIPGTITGGATGGVAVVVADESQISILERAAAGGDVEAMVELAGRYRSGNGVEQDAAAALRWLERAAEADDDGSMVALAKAYAAGDGVVADPAKAAGWFRKAAEAGNAEGRAAYAECLWEGRGTARNREEAFRLAELAADEGYPVAQRIAGLCHRDGIGTGRDPRKAAIWLRDAAQGDDAEAQFAWSQILARGDGVPQNVASAVEWAKKAAEQGIPEAQVFVGESYAGGAATGTPDQAEAMRWYRLAAEKGHAPAQSLVGTHLLFGLGVEKNQAEGVKWLEKAAAQEYGLAFSNLARCYAEGWGVPQDYAKAAEMMRKGAELGDPDSMGEYGSSLVLGKIVEKNPSEGLYWMTKAAETGRADMQLALANVLLNGLAGRADETAGMDWLEKAAASGSSRSASEAQSQLAVRLQKKDPEHNAERVFDLHLAAARAGIVVSQSQVATCYYNGAGCDRDYAEAVRWYKAAADGGDEDAMLGLANCHERGRGTPVNEKEALRWYRQASRSSNPDIAAVGERGVARLSSDDAVSILRTRAEAGDIIAMYDLAQRLDEGKGVAKDPKEAVKWWGKAAKVPGLRKDVGPLQIGAWVQYGVHLLDGVGVDRDAGEAAKWLKKAAEDTEEKDNLGLTDANLKLKALACRRLAECYDRGDGVPRDLRQATTWYQAGAMNGDIESNLELGDRFADGRAGYKDPFGPQRWYERAALRGSAEGAYRAGMTYARSGAMWRSKAEQWLKKAQDMGHPKAEQALRDLRAGAIKPPSSSSSSSKGGTSGAISAADAHNRGVAAAKRPGGMAEAEKWYRMAAEQGFGPSCANLGRMYYLGEGVRQDYAEAVKWYRKGAEADHAVAQNGLAVCYLNGRGVPKNAAEAVKWFQKSAEQGYALAQHSLGACYYNGDGVQKNRTEAIKWFQKAAAQGNAQSKDALRRLGIR